MKRLGTVIVFKEDVTEAEAQKALEAIKGVLDENYFITGTPLIHEYNDRDGGPVWYIP